MMSYHGWFWLHCFHLSQVSILFLADFALVLSKIFQLFKQTTMLTDLTLHEYAATGDVKQIEAHVKLGKTASINDQDDEYGYRTPLHIAAQKG